MDFFRVLYAQTCPCEVRQMTEEQVTEVCAFRCVSKISQERDIEILQAMGCFYKSLYFGDLLNWFRILSGQKIIR